MSCPSRGLLSVQLPRLWQPVVSCRPLLARVRLHLVVDGMSARHAGVCLWVVMLTTVDLSKACTRP